MRHPGGREPFGSSRPGWRTRLTSIPLIATLRQRLPRHLRRTRADQDLDAEIQAHLAIDAQARIDEGASTDIAWQDARRDFGSVPIVKEATREVWGGSALERLLADVRDSLRRLLRQPAFTAAIVVILALGIGTTVAALSVINAAFVKRLPVDAPGELVWFAGPGFSDEIAREVEARSGPIFSGFFAWSFGTLATEWIVDGGTMAGGEASAATDAAPVQALFVDEDFADTLRLTAARGRLLDARDLAGAERLAATAAVITDDAWTRHFGRDPDIIGRQIRVERVPVTIVGVTPAGFTGVAPGLAAEIMLPLTAQAALKPQEARNSLHFMARLRGGVSRHQADAALQTFWPDVLEAVTGRDEPPARRAMYLSRRTALRPADAGYSPVRDRLTRPLAVLVGLVLLFLLVGCASVASLLLVRGVSRQRELAIRIALGGTCARIARQLLIEGLLLALFATLVAAFIAHWSAAAIVALLSTPQQPLAFDLSPDARVAALTVLVALLTGLVFSLAPAVQTWKLQPGPTLKASVKPVHQGLERRPIGKALVILEVALATLLIAAAALLTRSVQRLIGLDPGFEIERLVIVSLDDSAVRRQAGGRMLTSPRSAPEAHPSAAPASPGASLLGAHFQRTLQERLRALPGVEAVSLSWVPPVSGEAGARTRTVKVDRNPTPVEAGGPTYFNFVSPGYFATVGQTLRRGRDFTSSDLQSGAARTCIISDALARLAFPQRDPIGRTISIGLAASRQDLTIVGIVEDAKYQRLQDETTPIAYLPLREPDADDSLARVSLVAEVRAQIPPATLVEPIRREVRQLDPTLIVRVEPMAARVRDSLVAERMMATLSIVAGALALFLASTGLYGLLAYTVSSRTGEIGVRMTLGARPSSVRWMVLRDSLTLSGVGLIVGLGVAVAASRLAEGWLQALSAGDRAAALSVAAAVTLAVIVAASLVPAYRASRIDPLRALRHE